MMRLHYRKEEIEEVVKLEGEREVCLLVEETDKNLIN
jgi:hypothetical protein